MVDHGSSIFVFKILNPIFNQRELELQCFALRNPRALQKAVYPRHKGGGVFLFFFP